MTAWPYLLDIALETAVKVLQVKFVNLRLIVESLQTLP